MDFLRGFDQEERALVAVLTIPGKDASRVWGSYSCLSASASALSLSVSFIYIYIYSGVVVVGEINLGNCQHDLYQPWLTCRDFNLINFFSILVPIEARNMCFGC